MQPDRAPILRRERAELNLELIEGKAIMRKYTPAPFAAVDFGEGFWHERLETVLTRTITSQYEQLQRHGILESMRAPKPAPPLRIPVSNHGMSTQVFWDSDVGKWIEAASYALSHRRDAIIEARIEEITDWLAQTQLADGYLNCWYIGREIDKRWTNLRDRHELYCAGHMIEGAVAYFQATGRRRLLDIFCRYVDHIAATFGPGPGQKRGYCGHPEIELALIKLHHVTGNPAHLDLAAYFVDERGNQSPHYFDVEAVARGDDPGKYWFSTHEYSQSHKPVREQDKAVGHAVRALYLYAAMADLASDIGDPSLKKACEAVWRDVTTKRMYVTAGVGPSASNEGFTKDYDLPNDTAYAETCASVALIFWAQRMLNIDCDGAYADVLELALYNGALSGLSREGTRYFYQNPLESDGSHKRWEWHPCPCCTMNVARLVASVGGYFYSTGEGRIHPETAHPRLGALLQHRSQRRPAGECRGEPRLCADPPRMAQRRCRRTRPAHARREALRQSQRPRRYRTGRPAARPVDLLRRGNRQSLDANASATAAQGGAGARRIPEGSVRRNRHHRCRRRGREGRRGRRSLPDAALPAPRRPTDRCPLLYLEQSRTQSHGGLAAGDIEPSIARERSDEAIQAQFQRTVVSIGRQGVCEAVRTDRDAAQSGLLRRCAHSQLCRFTNSLMCRIGDKSFNSIRSGRFSARRRGPRRRETNDTETVECDPSFRMAERVSPLRPLSMMAFQATAGGGDRFRGRH
jgi:hypothetical protein